jgi:hypothetical protein
LPFVAIVEERTDTQPTTSDDHVLRKSRYIAVLKDDHPFGRFDGSILFHLGPKTDGESGSDFAVPIHVHAVPPLYADPDAVFGTITNGAALPTWSVLLKTRSEHASRKGASAICSADWLMAELQDAGPLDPPESKGEVPVLQRLAIRVIETPRSSPTRATVTVTSADADTPAIVISVVVVLDAAVLATDGGN